MTKTSTTILSFAGAILLLASAASFAQTTSAPLLSEGDNWIYNVTEEKNFSGTLSTTTRKWANSITRAGTKTVALSVKPLDNNLPPRELSRDADWSIVQNINGKNTITSHPYDFPLKPGKTWKVEYVTDNPDARTKQQKVTRNYTVVGWVDVKVPAGTYHALKVEMEGEWSREFNEVGPTTSATVTNGQTGSVAVAANLKTNTPKPVSGRLYDAFWYVPEMKSHVKVISEDYQAGGALNKRITEELEASQIN